MDILTEPYSIPSGIDNTVRLTELAHVLQQTHDYPRYHSMGGTDHIIKKEMDKEANNNARSDFERLFVEQFVGSVLEGKNNTPITFKWLKWNTNANNYDVCFGSGEKFSDHYWFYIDHNTVAIRGHNIFALSDNDKKLLQSMFAFRGVDGKPIEKLFFDTESRLS